MTAPAPVSGCSAWAGVEDIPARAAGLHHPTAWCGFLALATDVLWAATGRRWRGETLTEEVALRAAPPRPGEGAWPYHRSWGRCCFTGLDIDGNPRWALGTGRHHAPAAVRLPRRDVVAVDVVELDGEPFEAWRLDGSWLTRSDGHGWPVCGDRTTVSYRYGHRPPEAGRTACVELAVELGRAAHPNPDQPCALPRRLQSVTRQGITFAALDDMEFLSEGLTGLYGVDLWIRSVNPHGRAQAGSVWSPDLPTAGRR